MDIVAIHKQLVDFGFPMDIADIQALIEALNGAIASGKLKQSTSPDRSRYPMRQVLNFLHDKDNSGNYYPLWWNKAVERCPELADFKVLASYSQSITQQKSVKSGVLSLTIEGIVLLAAVLKLKPIKLYPAVERVSNLQPEVTEEALDSRIPIQSTHIYVLKDVANKVLKVGVTNDIENRLIQHKSSNPFLVAIGFFPVNSKRQETLLHKLLLPYRIPGLREWYSDIPEVRDLIAQYFFGY
jgi:hypothetical protein